VENIVLLPTAKTNFYNEAKDNILRLREDIINYMSDSICTPEPKKARRYHEILEMLLADESVERRKLILELEDVMLDIENDKLEKATFYLLENGEEFKKTVLGF